MNTWVAFAMGEANRGKELMVFDWDKAARLIREKKPKWASAGLRSIIISGKTPGIAHWSEYDIPATKVWDAIGKKPLFGHHSGKQSRTFWACFMKLEEMEMLDAKD